MTCGILASTCCLLNHLGLLSPLPSLLVPLFLVHPILDLDLRTSHLLFLCLENSPPDIFTRWIPSPPQRTFSPQPSSRSSSLTFNMSSLDFPPGEVDKNLPASAGESGFDPWFGKIPHAAEQPRPMSGAHELQLLKPASLGPLRSKRSPRKEKPTHRNEESPPLTTTRARPSKAMKTPAQPNK